VAKRSSGRILAQAKLARLDEKLSRSSDSSSPRREFAQLTGVSFWYFRSGETNSPRRNYQKILPVLHMQTRSKTIPTQFHTLAVSNINYTSNHAIKALPNTNHTKMSYKVSFPYLFVKNSLGRVKKLARQQNFQSGPKRTLHHSRKKKEFHDQIRNSEIIFRNSSWT